MEALITYGPFLSSVLLGGAVALGVLWLPTFWDALARRQIADLAPRMRELGLDEGRLPAYLRLWGLGLVGTVFLFVFVLDMPLLAIVAVYPLYLLPRWILAQQIAHRRTLLRNQMVGASLLLANSTRAGLALAQGLESASRECPEPLALEFRRIVREFDSGRPLADALRDAQKRLNLDSFTLFSAAILTCLERGGKVTEALENISRSLQENQRLERKLEADTASGRRVVLILGLFPLLFLGGFYALDPEGTGILFESFAGQVILLVVAGLVYFSVRWAQRIINMET